MTVMWRSRVLPLAALSVATACQGAYTESTGTTSGGVHSLELGSGAAADDTTGQVSPATGAGSTATGSTAKASDDTATADPDWLEPDDLDGSDEDAPSSVMDDHSPPRACVELSPETLAPSLDGCSMLLLDVALELEPGDLQVEWRESAQAPAHAWSGTPSLNCAAPLHDAGARDDGVALEGPLEPWSLRVEPQDTWLDVCPTSCATLRSAASSISVCSSYGLTGPSVVK